MTKLMNELLELERKFWNAAGDPAIYKTHFSEDGLAMLPMNDGILSKERVMASVPAGKPWSNVKMQNEHLLELDKNVVALIYEGVGQREGEAPYTALITSVYRNDGGWKLTLHQQTPLG